MDQIPFPVAERGKDQIHLERIAAGQAVVRGYGVGGVGPN